MEYSISQIQIPPVHSRKGIEVDLKGAYYILSMNLLDEFRSFRILGDVELFVETIVAPILIGLMQYRSDQLGNIYIALNPSESFFTI